jgi:hypothetical protein
MRRTNLKKLCAEIFHLHTALVGLKGQKSK